MTAIGVNVGKIAAEYCSREDQRRISGAGLGAGNQFLGYTPSTHRDKSEEDCSHHKNEHVPTNYEHGCQEKFWSPDISGLPVVPGRKNTMASICCLRISRQILYFIDNLTTSMSNHVLNGLLHTQVIFTWVAGQLSISADAFPASYCSQPETKMMPNGIIKHDSSRLWQILTPPLLGRNTTLTNEGISRTSSLNKRSWSKTRMTSTSNA
ncbi:hypothetical protein J437_LFUL001012 [Ladona fulva]|uniref:Uncharacterized protein n=1 Tax=Ladona fulva TaxID=123851 RepID=A0A8K0P4N6_LADFU|nr:hypothetical protein J437_LFUL001012 [Ladona fulva]